METERLQSPERQAGTVRARSDVLARHEVRREICIFWECFTAVASRNMSMTMKAQELFDIWNGLLLLFCLVLLSCAAAQAQKKSKYICDQEQPESMCNAANTWVHRRLRAKLTSRGQPTTLM